MIYILSTSRNVLNNQPLNDVRFLDLLGIELIDFDIDPEVLRSAKYVILTSKNSVRSILRHRLAGDLLKKKAIVIGNSTGRTWMEHGGKILYSPNVSCNGRRLAQLLIKHRHERINGSVVLYPCAKNRLTDFGELLAPHCKVVDIFVYESYEKTIPEEASRFVRDAPKNSIFVFGSPNIYRTFINNYGWRPDWVAISLGSTTFLSFDTDIKKVNANGSFSDALSIARNIAASSSASVKSYFAKDQNQKAAKA